MVCRWAQGWAFFQVGILHPYTLRSDILEWQKPSSSWASVFEGFRDRTLAQQRWAREWIVKSTCSMMFSSRCWGRTPVNPSIFLNPQESPQFCPTKHFYHHSRCSYDSYIEIYIYINTYIPSLHEWSIICVRAHVFVCLCMFFLIFPCVDIRAIMHCHWSSWDLRTVCSWDPMGTFTRHNLRG